MNHLFDVNAQRFVRVDREEEMSNVCVYEIPMVAELHVVEQRGLRHSRYTRVF